MNSVLTLMAWSCSIMFRVLMKQSISSMKMMDGASLLAKLHIIKSAQNQNNNDNARVGGKLTPVQKNGGNPVANAVTMCRGKTPHPSVIRLTPNLRLKNEWGQLDALLLHIVHDRKKRS